MGLPSAVSGFLSHHPSCHHPGKLTWRFFILHSSDAELQTVSLLSVCSSSLFIPSTFCCFYLTDRLRLWLVSGSRFCKAELCRQTSPRLRIFSNPRWLKASERTQERRDEEVFKSKTDFSPRAIPNNMQIISLVSYSHVIYTLRLYLNAYFI